MAHRDIKPDNILVFRPNSSSSNQISRNNAENSSGSSSYYIATAAVGAVGAGGETDMFHETVCLFQGTGVTDVDGSSWTVKLADWKFACNFSSGGCEMLTDPVGTVSYAAPEILGGLVRGNKNRCSSII